MHRHTHTHRRPARLLIGSFKSRFYFHSSYCNGNKALVIGAIKGIEYCIKNDQFSTVMTVQGATDEKVESEMIREAPILQEDGIYSCFTV